MLDVQRYKKAKAAGTVRLVKIGGSVAALFKRFDPDTGVFIVDDKQEFTLAELNGTISNYDAQKAIIDAQIVDVNVVITDMGDLPDLLEDEG